DGVGVTPRTGCACAPHGNWKRRQTRSAPAFYRVARFVPPGWCSAAGGSGQPAPRELDPVGAAQRDECVVEVVGAVVQCAGAHTVALFTMVALAVADPDIAAGLVLQHEREVFGAHRRRDV